MFTSVVITTPEEPREIIAKTINSAITQHPSIIKEEFGTKRELMSVDDVLIFFAECGMPISRSTLYHLTSTQRIPFRKFGKRCVFNRNELREWMSSRMQKDVPRQETMARRISQSVERRRRKF